MPRKTKETKKAKDTALLGELKSIVTKKSVDEKKKKSTKKSVTKTSEKKSTKATKTTTKKVTSKANKVDSTSKETKKSTIKAKKDVAKISSRNKKTTTKSAILSKEDFSPEYYDLPYRYNQTIVKLLAQTPNNLFVYWDISDEDRNNLKSYFGEYFFEITKPVLIVRNETMNYAFEVDIDDFANSWYIHVNDSDCKYSIELGRRPIPVNYSYMPQYDIKKNGPIEPIHEEYIFITSSNELISPNDRILFNITNPVSFRNLKTGETVKRDISEFPFIYKDNNFVNLYALYNNLYKGEISGNFMDLNNPSSGNPTSNMSSSWSN